MFLMFTLKRPNVLPTGDYGIQMAIKKHYKKRKMPKPEVMAKIAKSWEPYPSVACRYLWRSLDIKTMSGIADSILSSAANLRTEN